MYSHNLCRTALAVVAVLTNPEVCIANHSHKLSYAWAARYNTWLHQIDANRRSLVLSCLVLSCLVLSCLVSSCLVFSFLFVCHLKVTAMVCRGGRGPCSDAGGGQDGGSELQHLQQSHACRRHQGAFPRPACFSTIKRLCVHSLISSDKSAPASSCALALLCFFLTYVVSVLLKVMRPCRKSNASLYYVDLSHLATLTPHM